jgi:hypothetical protein
MVTTAPFKKLAGFGVAGSFIAAPFSVFQDDRALMLMFHFCTCYRKYFFI